MYDVEVSSAVPSPFSSVPLDEVPLDPAPLVSVICQLRFPRIVSLTEDTHLGRFQSAVRADYPVMRETRNQAVHLGPDGVMATEPQRMFRFEDVASAWVVTLAQDSVSLQTTRYTSRADFIGRVEHIFDTLESLDDTSPVAVYDRLGIRYTNRLVGVDASHQRLKTLTVPEVHGPLSTEEGLEDGHSLVVSVTHQEYTLDHFHVLARWASLPEHGALDPIEGVPAVPERSWVLDVDAFVDGQTPFDPAAATDTARQGAEHAYHLFRWAMTDQFMSERAAS